MTELVKILYVSPKFRIKIAEGMSDEFGQQIGIRQGCPLSPYLYIIVTTCLMRDLLKDWSETTNNDLPSGATYPALLFADDALLLADAATKMTELLSLVIKTTANPVTYH